MEMKRIPFNPSPASVGEGGAQPARAGRVRGLQCLQNGIDHAIGIGQDLIIPESKHPPALTLQPCRPATVGLTIGMLSAIDLDDEAVGDAGEIEDEWTERMLPPELITFQTPSAQSRPQPTFGIGQGGSQLARLAIGHGGKDSSKSLTLPKLRFGPLPLPQAGEGL